MMIFMYNINIRIYDVGRLHNKNLRETFQEQLSTKN